MVAETQIEYVKISQFFTRRLKASSVRTVENSRDILSRGYTEQAHGLTMAHHLSVC